ncbi:MAG: hypothetical protein ACE5I1_09990 [bacterium]
MRFRMLVTGSWEKDEVIIFVSEKTPAWPNAFYRQAKIFWQQALKSEKKLFNGALSSLVSSHTNNNQLLLTLGRICYRDQMYSNNSMKNWKLEERNRYATRGLGISAVVETADRQVLMIVRSQYVSENAGFLDVIGGHVHPEDHAKEGKPDVFYAIADEMHCELGIDFRNIKKTVCIGLIENTEWLKPELVFVSNLNLAKAEVLECSKQAKERFECSKMVSFAANQTGVLSFLDEYRQRCTPSAEGCLELYKIHCDE